MKKIMAHFVVSTASADGLAPLGARPSAGTVMTTLNSLIGTILAPTELIPLSFPLNSLRPNDAYVRQ